jgi:hypothetical protein
MLLYFENNVNWAAVAGFQTVSPFLLQLWQIAKIDQKKCDSAVFVYFFIYSKLYTKKALSLYFLADFYNLHTVLMRIFS